ncbi:hypothetical protein HG537_0E02280 [Torulaspora globosa]|uniref:Major facilitator superfamily (MFS) profile domain-containing protein n=1 Tax=Torulaspora globosa TaxID=48254 RepID=A0A7H9HUF5_9SACH|nr:hypothetical protein HG537_0E02280 [Torulaspora sp. CBS 2947]
MGMLAFDIIVRPAKIFLLKTRNSWDSQNLELKSLDYPATSGFAPNGDLEDCILTKKNNVVEIGGSKLSNVKSKEFLDEGTLDDESEFPDRGLQAWLAVFGSFVGLVPVFGLLNSLGAIESYISRHQLASVPASTISWIFSLYLSMSFLSCIFAGGFFDRNGSLVLMCTGTVIYIGGIMCLANCYTVWQFILAFSILCGAGTGVLMTPLVSVLATWFLKRRAIATSVATMGGSVGGAIYPLMLKKLYKEVGYAWAIRITGFICLACLIVSTTLCRERELVQKKPFKSKTELMKWYVSSSLNWRYFLEWKFLFAALGASLAEASLTTSSTYLASYSLTRGNSESTSFALITVINAIGALGRYIPGYVADRYIGRFNVYIIAVTISGLSNLIIWLPFGGYTAALWVYACIYGFSSGSILSLTPVCIGQISRTEDFGKRYSTAYFLQAIVTIPMLPIAGVIINKGTVPEYNKFIVFVSVLMLAGAACNVITRHICVGTKLCRF